MLSFNDFNNIFALLRYMLYELINKKLSFYGFYYLSGD